MKLFRALSSAAVALVLAQASLAADGMPELDGQWESIACELRPQAGPDGVQPWFLKRSITFAGNRIDAHFTTYADASCTTPLVELKFGGDVVVQAASTVVEGAREVDLIVNDYLTVTPRMSGFVDFLNTAEAGSCGANSWSVGTEQNVFETGCSVMGIAPDTPSHEYELLLVSAGQLYFGARPVDGSALSQPDRRPTALQVPLALTQGGETRKVGADDLRVPQTVEIVRFKQVEGADPENVRKFFEAITKKMNQNGTLLYRTVAQGPDGTWLCVNYWSSREAMETLNAQAKDWTDEFAAMAELAQMSSFELTSYDLN